MNDLSKVFTDGNLVDVNVRMWTGERTLQPEDLGLKGENISGAFKLGKKSLIPNEVTSNFRRLDQKARAVLVKNSFSFVFGSSRFVPKKAFLKFSDEFEEVKQEYFAEVASLLENYDAYRLEMRTQYIDAAKSAYKRMVSIRKIDTDENLFIDEFIARVETFYPAKEELEAKFHMDYMVFQVALPDLTQASYDDLLDENEKIQMLQQAKQAELRKRIQKFVEDTVSGLREKASTVLTHLEGSIKAKKKITKASINAVINMIDDYINLDIIGDADFITKMVNFREDHLVHITDTVLRQSPNHADFICKELRNLVTLAEDKAIISYLTDAYKKKIEI